MTDNPKGHPMHPFVPAISLCLLTLVSTSNAEIVYTQSPSSEPDSIGLGWYSSSEPRPTRSYKHADNFVLEDTTLVSGLNWWGLTEGLNDTTYTNFDSFTIEFWSSMTLPNGRIKPETLMHTETLSILESSLAETGRHSPSGLVEYRHHYELDESIVLDADTTYWISISAHSVDPAGDVWQWQDADDADTISSSYDYSAERWLYLVDTDSAFELITVPAPATFPVLLLGIALRRRR
jgi:hypothetical protein